SSLQGLESADSILLVGVNPRTEAPLLNQRIRKSWLAGKTRVGVIGDAADLTYDFDPVGAGTKTLAKLPKAASDALSNAELPAIVVGAGALSGANGPAVLNALGKVAAKVGGVKDGWNGFNVLHHAAAR